MFKEPDDPRLADPAGEQSKRRSPDADQIGATQYLELQEDLDWKQLSVGSDEERRITES